MFICETNVWENIFEPIIIAVLTALISALGIVLSTRKKDRFKKRDKNVNVIPYFKLKKYLNANIYPNKKTYVVNSFAIELISNCICKDIYLLLNGKIVNSQKNTIKKKQRYYFSDFWCRNKINKIEIICKDEDDNYYKYSMNFNFKTIYKNTFDKSNYVCTSYIIKNVYGPIELLDTSANDLEIINKLNKKRK